MTLDEHVLQKTISIKHDDFAPLACVAHMKTPTLSAVTLIEFDRHVRVLQKQKGKQQNGQFKKQRIVVEKPGSEHKTRWYDYSKAAKWMHPHFKRHQHGVLIFSYRLISRMRVVLQIDHLTWRAWEKGDRGLPSTYACKIITYPVPHTWKSVSNFLVFRSVLKCT